MVRRVSALFFLTEMVILLLFQQPAFAYCAHSEQFFLNDCGCPEPVETSCPHCHQDEPAEPCDDCSEKIQLDLDELLWSDLAIDSPPFPDHFVAEEVDDTIRSGSSALAKAATIRPPPPPALSLYLLHSVFRL